jgi:hypothetical protein
LSPGLDRPSLSGSPLSATTLTYRGRVVEASMCRTPTRSVTQGPPSQLKPLCSQISPPYSGDLCRVPARVRRGRRIDEEDPRRDAGRVAEAGGAGADLCSDLELLARAEPVQSLRVDDRLAVGTTGTPLALRDAVLTAVGLGWVPGRTRTASAFPCPGRATSQENVEIVRGCSGRPREAALRELVRSSAAQASIRGKR